MKIANANQIGMSEILLATPCLMTSLNKQLYNAECWSIANYTKHFREKYLASGPSLKIFNPIPSDVYCEEHFPKRWLHKTTLKPIFVSNQCRLPIKQYIYKIASYSVCSHWYKDTGNKENISALTFTSEKRGSSPSKESPMGLNLFQNFQQTKLEVWYYRMHFQLMNNF